MINLAKETGTWTAMDDVENGVIPNNLQRAFDKNQKAFENYKTSLKATEKATYHG